MSTLVPPVEIDLDRIRHLRFDLNAWRLYKETFGKDWTQIALISDGLIDWQVTQNLLWVSLVCEDPDLTWEQAGQFMQPGNCQMVFETVTRMFQGTLPEAKETKPGDAPKNRRRSTGSKSGQSGGTTSA